MLKAALLLVVAWSQVVFGLLYLFLLLARRFTSKADIILNASLGLQGSEDGVAEFAVLAYVVSDSSCDVVILNLIHVILAGHLVRLLLLLDVRLSLLLLVLLQVHRVCLLRFVSLVHHFLRLIILD